MSYRPKIYDRGVVCAGGWILFWLHHPGCAMCADVRDRFWPHRTRNALCSAGCRGRWGSPRATLVQPARGWKGLREASLRSRSFGGGKSSAPRRELPLLAAPTQTQNMQPPAPSMMNATRRMRMIVAGDIPFEAAGAIGYCGCGCG